MILTACSTVMFSGDLPQKLIAMKEAGFTHTEITCSDLFSSLRGVEYSLDQIKASGLTVCGYSLIRDYEGCPESEIKLRTRIAGQLMEQANWLNTEVLIICSNTVIDSSSDRGRMRDDLRRLGDLASQKNIKLAYEALCWGVHISDYRDAWDLIQAVDHPHVGLLLDSSHIGALGLPMSDIGHIDVQKLFHVQIADLPGSNLPMVDLSRYYRMLPGDGVLPLEEFIDELESIDYKGGVALEILSDRYRSLAPLVAAQEAMTTVRRWERKLVAGGRVPLFHA